MNLSPILWIEISVAVFIGIGILWTNPEYGLFAYALALGFPDLAFRLGDAIHLRLDDVLIVLLLIRSFLWAGDAATPWQRKILAWQVFFLAACLLSIAVGVVRGTPPAAYDTAKMAGCAIIVLGFPRLIRSEKKLRFLLAGLMLAGIALSIQVLLHLGSSPARSFANIQELKAAAAFNTWNANSIGQAATMLVFAAGLGGIVFRKTPVSRILWPCLAVGFALLPALVFVRGTTLSIAAGFLLFLCILRRWKWAVLFALACVSVVLYLRSLDQPLLEDATQVNLATGEGFSHRFERWDIALRAIRTDPWVGQGFGQEMGSLSRIGGEGRAHNAYLAVWLELGLGGLLLFLAMILQFFRAGLFLYGNARYQSAGALILALVFALGLDSLALPTLYWEKLPCVALSIAVVLVGLCEGKKLELTKEEIRILLRELVSQPL
jgi:O-antigen ligase